MAFVGQALINAPMDAIVDRINVEIFIWKESHKLVNELTQQVYKLQLLLMSINAVGKNKQDRNVKSWLSRAHDVAYDAEDLLDEITIEGFSGRLESMGQTILSLVSRYFSSLFYREIESRLEEILGRPEYLSSL